MDNKKDNELFSTFRNLKGANFENEMMVFSQNIFYTIMRNFLNILILVIVYLFYIYFILNQSEHGGRLLRVTIAAILCFVFLSNKYTTFTKLYIAVYTVYVLFSIIIFESCLKLNSVSG